MKQVVRTVEKSTFEIALIGLSASAKKRLFSVLPIHKADEYAQDCMYMGPVRQTDVLEAFAELLALFEKQRPLPGMEDTNR